MRYICKYIISQSQSIVQDTHKSVCNIFRVVLLSRQENQEILVNSANFPTTCHHNPPKTRPGGFGPKITGLPIQLHCLKYVRYIIIYIIIYIYISIIPYIYIIKQLSSQYTLESVPQRIRLTVVKGGSIGRHW